MASAPWDMTPLLLPGTTPPPLAAAFALSDHTATASACFNDAVASAGMPAASLAIAEAPPHLKGTAARTAQRQLRLAAQTEPLPSPRVSPPGSGVLEITGVEPCDRSPEISSLCLGSFQDLRLPSSGPQLCDPQRKRPGQSSGVLQVQGLRMQAGLPCPSAEGALEITESWGLEGQS
ncbi:hypothetical protein P7K49_040392 [Saguinus oedipus]|uniref:Uncharacterized protein n=1 Tax=Saguinus oedipus TaxID=9490 RepID=A0ABQ9T967_SAGOE|nr:hypothetical protein P7K49_040392 [Saguinus oedipus]